MTNLMKLETILTMDSLEIADLTGKRHDNVLTDIKKMLTELELHAPDFSGTQKYGNNNTREVYNLPKRENMILVSGYNLAMRAKIILKDEEMHEKAFGVLSSQEAKNSVKSMHDAGVKALGLVI